MAAHELHKADAVRICRCLHVGGVNGLLRLFASRVKAESPINERDVVVNGLGNTHHSTLMTDLLHGLEALHCALVRAIAAQHKILPHVPPLKNCSDVGVCRVPAVADQHAPSLHVDVLHMLFREFHPLVIRHTTPEASDDAIDLCHTICVQHLHNLADHGVQAGAQAPACDNGCGTSRLLRVKVDEPPRSATLHLQVGLRTRVFAVDMLEDLRRPRVWSDTLCTQKSSRWVLHLLGGEFVAQVGAVQTSDCRAGVEHF
mmetsp:Transcript_22582/g.52740  ORF Transcript_22582/g.52740 Transcript_22582/m.52740 type:complete len:258 (+) Transcript_22582:670-1443(+)